MMLQGAAASGGIGIGTAVVLREHTLDYGHVVYQGAQAEQKRLQEAIASFCAATEAMASSLAKTAGSHEGDILLGQIAMVQDPFLLEQMEEQLAAGAVAEGAVDTVCESFAMMFEGVDDEMMRQRAIDVRDMKTRLLRLLLGIEETALSDLPDGCVVAARDLTPSMTVGLEKGKLSALLSEVGGQTSHSAILAKALGIPAVLGVGDLLSQLKDGDLVVVDGDSGHVFCNPEEETLLSYRDRQQQQLAAQSLLEQYRDCPTETQDGHRVLLYSNIGSLAEAEIAAENGAEGIGLFRTEFLFMDTNRLPTEEEQYTVYHQVAQRFADKEVIIRTLDVGGDKAVPYLGLEREENPFLGFRAIRYCLERTDVFKTQLRAILRAGAAFPKVKLMLPLVTGLEELREAKKLVETCQQELEQEGVPYHKTIEVGVMIETPAASMISDLLAKEADFFSIGTNDLTQYTMAVDRGNSKVSGLYSPLHPAVVRSIRQVIANGKAAGIPVGMCGEAAGDERMIPLLLSFGLDEFSVGSSSVLQTRKRIAQWTMAQARAVADDAMTLGTAEEMAQRLEKRQ